MNYKKSDISPKLTEDRESTETPVEEPQPQCVSIFLELFQESQNNFESEDMDALRKNFIDIVNLIEKGGLLCIPELTVIQYSIDLIKIIDQLNTNPEQQLTVYYGLRIIHHFFYIRTSIMNHLILNGYLPFFINLIHSPEKHVKETSAYIGVLFFLSNELVPIALDSSLFSDLCDTFLIYLEDVKENCPILMVISKAFNTLTKYFNENENVTIEMIERIMELYSLSLKDNYETKLISCFIEFLQVLKYKIDESIVSFLFKYNLPNEFYQILIKSKTFKTKSLYFFSFLTCYIKEDDYSQMKEFFDFAELLTLLTNTKQFTLTDQSYALLIIENSLKFDFDLLNMVTSELFLAYIIKNFRIGEFQLKYRSGRCLFAALNAASNSSIEIVQKLFSSEIMIIGLDIFECEEPDLIDQSLNTIDYAMTLLYDVSGKEQLQFYEAFELKLLQTLEELQSSEDENIKMHAYEIQKKFFEKDCQLTFDQEESVIKYEDK